MTHSPRFHRSLLVTAIAIGTLSGGTWRADAGAYVQTDLVSDLPAVGATITEPELVNPWGISHSSTSPFWTSNQGTSTATLFGVTGQTNVTKVSPANTNGNIAIPPTGGPGPTGQVFNGNTDPSSFPVTGGDGKSAHFIFANLNGTIAAWDLGSTAFTQVTTPGAVYTGLAISQGSTRIYAANDAGAGSINVFDTMFHPVTTLPTGAFATPAAVSALNLFPFNVQDINGKVYVTYAPSGRAAQSGASSGQGAVVVFNEDGTSPQILILGSDLAAPWGVALAPAGFGQFGGDLLVGNFSFVNSEINAFNPTTLTTGAPIGTITVDPGSGQTPGGLWALSFGTGMGNGGDPNTLYFNDGIDGETHGLFAALTPAVPEPSSLALLTAALGFLAIRRAGSHRRV
jgi:uncharacterized protein (TIGR03118 family)